MKTKTKTTTTRLRESSPPPEGASAAPQRLARPSIGDPELEQMLPDDGDLPDLDNETVHKTQRPEGAVIPDDDLDDEPAEESEVDRREDVTESNPLHVGHFVGR